MEAEHISNEDVDCLWDIIDPEEEEKRLERERQRSVSVKASCEMHKMRRVASEFALEKQLPWHFEQGTTYHCISYGDVDSLSYLRVILKQQRLEYMLLSTWCMALADAEEIKSWLDRGYIKRIDFYVGEYFPKSYAAVYRYLQENCLRNGAMVSAFRNHSKIMAGFGEKFDFAIESSANVNTNPRCEQTAITVNTDVALFYKDFYDSLETHSQRYGWKPYQLERMRNITPSSD